MTEIYRSYTIETLSSDAGQTEYLVRAHGNLLFAFDTMDDAYSFVDRIKKGGYKDTRQFVP